MRGDKYIGQLENHLTRVCQIYETDVLQLKDRETFVSMCLLSRKNIQWNPVWNQLWQMKKYEMPSKEKEEEVNASFINSEILGIPSIYF